ncbi:MAG TPA: FAD-dependent oxidoreductase, partial [Candidatus Polarisedimenticolia bacterium]|nr:FAD-dependent oxidoreductase [Candidatus Polarisedimenticolia bacterium]
MAQFHKGANVVIIGQGGIVGASVAHHLIERGWDNIIGIDKSGIPTDIGSTGHASDFCFNTMHDQMTIFTTRYSIDFFEKRGRYSRIGGIEVAREGDDERMRELERRVSSGRAFGNRVELITPKKVKELMPLVEESMIQGALWDPDAGLVIPRSQVVAGEMIRDAEATGKLQVMANTPCTGLDIQNGRIRGVHTSRGYIEAPYVVVCAGLWGRLIAEMAGEDLPVMPVDHPLTFFGPYTEFAGTGKEIGYPLLRDQGNSAYLRDTGDPKTSEGGQIEWGYYEEKDPRLVHPRDLLEKEEARLSPSQRDLEMEQIIEPLERAMALTPILGELGYNEKHSFNGLLQVTADGGPSIGESPDVRGLWYGVSVWIKDGPGTGKVIADWMTDGRTEIDHHSIDYARYYPIQKTERYIHDRCYETAFKIYNPPVHNREPYSKGRNLRCTPFYLREKELGGYFMEIAGWERAHGYASNEQTLLAKYANRVPERLNEWDNRHFWRVSNAEHLELSENVGMVNLSHFAIYDVSGRDAERLMEYVSSSKVAGDTPVGKGVYTNFLDAAGGVQADLTVLRLAEDRFRVIDGADAGNRDATYLRRMTQDKEWSVFVEDRTDHYGCIGVWGPNARASLKTLADNPAGLDPQNFPFAASRDFTLRGVPVKGFRISYVGEQGWELHFPLSYGLALWDMFREIGITPIGIETYANSRRLEKSLRLQNADLLTEYNLVEAGLARPKIKDADFHGKAAYLKHRERAHQPAMLCTLTVTDNTDRDGVARFPTGNCPIIDPKTDAVLIDSHGRRSYTTSLAYGPSIGKN